MVMDGDKVWSMIMTTWTIWTDNVHLLSGKWLMLIVAGDWSARPGPADPATRHILGKFAVGTRCVNGDRLVNFASANRLFGVQHSLPTPTTPPCDVVL